MLIGELEGKLTDKNRIALPKRYRDELQGRVFVTRGYEDCLIILDEKRWDKLISGIEVKPFLNRSVRDTKRFIVGGAAEVRLDSQGRFAISENQKKYANITHAVTFVGIIDWLELWSLEKWELKVNELKNSAEEIAERLIK